MKDPITTVGVDIGSTFIRGVQVTKKRSGYVIDKVGVVPTPEKSVIEGAVADQKAVAAALRDLWKEAKFDSQFVKLGIGSSKVYTQLIEVDQMPKDLFIDVMPSLLQDVVPEDGDFKFVYHQISSFSKIEKDPRNAEETITKSKMQVVYAAIPNDIITDLILTCRAAKLKPISIDLNPFALLRATTSETGSADGAQISIDIGGSTTTLVISVAGQPRYTLVSSGSADIPVGGRDITELIAKEFNIPMDKAEERKMEAIHGELPSMSDNAAGYDEDASFTSAFGGAGGSNRPVDEDERARTNRLLRARQIANKVLSETVEAIESAVSDFETSPYAHDFASGTITIHPTVLSGGVMGTKNIEDRIQRAMSAHPTVMAKPLSSRNFNKDIPNEHEYTIAVGLAVGEGGQS